MKFTQDHLELIEFVATAGCQPKHIAALVKIISELPQPPETPEQITTRLKAMRSIYDKRYRDKKKLEEHT